jgi:predicted dehydrogenase
VECYNAENFDKMLTDLNRDTVIICTKDCTHDEYICLALETGCDVITEKPVTTDAEKCQHIVNTAKKTGKSIRVTFNYRYSPSRTQKKLLMNRILGDVLSVEFNGCLIPVMKRITSDAGIVIKRIPVDL